MSTEPVLHRIDLGEVAYDEAMRSMDRWREERLAGEAGDRLFLLSHPPVVTYTGRTPPDDLPDAALGIPTVSTDRGGLATYHGPGQLIGYLVIDLGRRGPVDIVRWVENRLIDACGRLGFEAVRRDTPKGGASLVGVWTPDHRKLVSIGMRIRQKVTSHGFALNVDPDMTVFDQFTACGLNDVTMTSLAQLAAEQQRPAPTAEQVRDAVAAAFGAVSERPAAAPAPAPAVARPASASLPRP